MLHRILHFATHESVDYLYVMPILCHSLYSLFFFSLFLSQFSKEDTIGTPLVVLYREVSLIQRWICTQFNVVGTADSVLIIEVPLIQSVLYREVPL